MYKYSTYTMNNCNDFYMSASCLDIFENISFLHSGADFPIGASPSDYCISQKNAYLTISYGHINETICKINGKTYAVKEGEFLIQGRGSINSQTAGKGGSVTYGVRVNPQFCKKYGLCDDIVCHIKSDEKMKELFVNLIRAYDENPGASSTTTAVLQLLMYINRKYKQYSAKLDDSGILSDKQMEKVVKYINRNIFNKIHLSDMAKLLNLEQTYFCHKFKKTCGQSPIAYANFLRCENARVILLTTDFMPKEVIEACGFRSMSHFKSMYKKLTGRDVLIDAATEPVEIEVKK